MFRTPPIALLSPALLPTLMSSLVNYPLPFIRVARTCTDVGQFLNLGRFTSDDSPEEN